MPTFVGDLVRFRVSSTFIGWEYTLSSISWLMYLFAINRQLRYTEVHRGLQKVPGQQLHAHKI